MPGILQPLPAPPRLQVRFLPIAAIAVLACYGVSAIHAADEPGFTPLFDGKTLAGWEGDEKVFHVKDGAIVAGSLSEKVAHNDFLASKEEFGDFELRLKA